MNRLPPTLRSTIARATNNPVRAGFLWSAGTHLADLAFGLLRLIMMLALLAALAGAAYYALQKAPDRTKPPTASSAKTPKAGNGTPERMQGSPQGRAGSIPASRSERPQNTAN